MSVNSQPGPVTRRRKANLEPNAAPGGQDNLPPPRTKKGMRDVAPPFYFTPWKKFIYFISFAAILLALFYTWRLTQWKAEAGGWWNLMLGRHPHQPVTTPYVKSQPHKPTLEERIRDLSDELGVHPRELASAIRPLLPTASATSIANANPTAPGSAVSVLADADVPLQQQEHHHNILDGLSAIVGLDEPVDMDD